MNSLEDAAQAAHAGYPDASAPTSAGLNGQTAETAAQPETFVLRRTGKRPLVVRGRELASEMSFRVGTPFWYEINLFRVENAGFAADVRFFTKASDAKDKFTVAMGETLDDVARFLESYDPSADVSVDPELVDLTSSSASAAFGLLALRARVDSAREQYESLVTEVFNALDPKWIATADPV